MAQQTVVSLTNSSNGLRTSRTFFVPKKSPLVLLRLARRYVFKVRKMKVCVQCGCEIDFMVDDLTLYQVDKNRYLYCANCQNPREPYISSSQVMDMRDTIKSHESTINKSWQGNLILFVIGIIVGWFLF